MNKTSQVIGRSVPRVDARDKLTGSANYAADLSFDGMLHLKVLRSDRPHAKILGIDTAAAKGHSGVVAVFTYLDIPGKNRLRNGLQIFCGDKVRYVGDPVALVAAETLESAQEALKLIKVEYEDLPGVFSPEAALLPDAPQVYDTGNVFMEKTLRKGNPEAALPEAAIVITNTYQTQVVEHAYMEPEAGIAQRDDDKVTVWMPSKYAHSSRKEIASVLGIPAEQVRIYNTAIGGSFGDRSSLAPGHYAALASFKTGRPAKLVYSREESFFASTKRHPFTIKYTTAAAADGRLCAVDIEITADVGAYNGSSPAVFGKSLVHGSGPYEIPHILLKIRGAYTNNPVSASMRGLGVPQVAFAHESQMNILAERLGLDPFEIRLRNALRPGSITATGQCLGSSVGLVETLQKVRDEIARRGTPENSPARRYGWGIASSFYGIGQPGRPVPGVARIEASSAGGFTLYVGCGDVGQGSNTILSQIAAEGLNCRMEDIRIISNDTDLCPDSGAAVASRVTYFVGRAVQIAAEKLKRLLQEAAASVIGSSPDDLQLQRGGFCVFSSPQKTVSIGQAVNRLAEEGRLPQAEGTFAPETVPLDENTSQGVPMATYAFATQAALVSVDMDSGEVELLSLVASHDVGKAINPYAVVGQIEGSVAMGLGFGLMEEIVLQSGSIKNPSFAEYYVPTSLDTPEIMTILVEETEESGPYGAKGIGEPALIPTAPAIINAIQTAAGVRPKTLPVTPEALWNLLHALP